MIIWDKDELRTCISAKVLLTMSTKEARDWKDPYYGGLTRIYTNLLGKDGDPLSNKNDRIFIAYALFPENEEVKKAWRNAQRTVEKWKSFFRVTIRSKKFLSMNRAQLLSWRDARTKDTLKTVMTKIGLKGTPASYRADLKLLLRTLHPLDDLDALEKEMKSKQ